MDPKGKTVVVTGATSGLGQAFAIDVAARGAKVVLVGRDSARAEETRGRIAAAGGDVSVVLGDVSTVSGARAVATSILEKHARIDVLVNNAGGVFKTPSRTTDGLETTFALNTLAAWVLEKALHGAISAARGRVVNVATGFLDSFPIVFDQLLEPKKYSGFTQYGRAKQALVMLTVEQAKRHAGEGIAYVALHPGIVMGTRFGGGQPKAMQLLAGPVMRLAGIACTPEEALRRFHVAAFGDVPSGTYLVKGRASALPKPSRDEAMRARVVSLVEKLAA